MNGLTRFHTALLLCMVVWLMGPPSMAQVARPEVLLPVAAANSAASAPNRASTDRYSAPEQSPLKSLSASAAFTQTGQITLEKPEDGADAAVLDANNGFAYFGTAQGIVEKVRLSDFTRVAALDLRLPPGAEGLVSAVVDTVNGYAYFGTAGRLVVKIRLSDFTAVATLTLPADEFMLSSAVIDTSNGFAYFGTANFPSWQTDNSPSKIVRIRLSDFTRVDALALYADEFLRFTTGVLDKASGFAYFGTECPSTPCPGPAKIVKVHLLDFRRTATMTLNADEPGINTAVMDATGAYAYFGTSTTPAHIVKVRLSNFTRVGTLILNANETAYTSVIDSQNGSALFGGRGMVVKVNLSNFSRTGAIPLNSAYPSVSAVMDGNSGVAYFGMDSFPAQVFAIRTSDFVQIGTLSFPAGEGYLSAAIVDMVGGFAYFPAYGTSTNVVKIRLSDFTRVGALSLPLDRLSILSAVIDSDNGFAYLGGVIVGEAIIPGLIIKVRLSDFTLVSTLDLEPGENYPNRSIIDSANGFMYVGVYPGVLVPGPAKIVKIRLSDFTRVDTLVLNPDENSIGAAVIDTTNGFAYFGVNRSSYPAHAIKVRLSDFALVGRLALDSGDGFLSSGIIDTANGFAYFGGSALSPSGGTVVKIRLSDLVRVSAIQLTSASTSTTHSNPVQLDPQIAPPGPVDVDLRAALLDPVGGLAYFGNDRGDVFKVRLQDFAQVDQLRLSGAIGCAVIDSLNGYAYFGINNFVPPSSIAKVDIANLAITNSVSASTAGAGDTLAYTHTITNQDIYTATGLVLTSTLPLSTTFVSATPDSPACNDVSGRVICTLGDLPAGASARVTIRAQVNVSTTVALINTTQITADHARSHLPNNTVRIITLVNPLRTYFPLFFR